MKCVQAVCNIYLSFPTEMDSMEVHHITTKPSTKKQQNKNSRVPSLPTQSTHTLGLLPCSSTTWLKKNSTRTNTGVCGLLHRSVHQCTRQTHRERQHLKSVSLWSVLEKKKIGQFVIELWLPREKVERYYINKHFICAPECTCFFSDHEHSCTTTRNCASVKLIPQRFFILIIAMQKCKPRGRMLVRILENPEHHYFYTASHWTKTFSSQYIRCHHDNLLGQNLSLSRWAQISVSC